MGFCCTSMLAFLLVVLAIETIVVVAQDPCDPGTTTADETLLCPVVDCAHDALPNGCSFTPDTAPFEVISNDGTCCQRQCYATVDATGQECPAAGEVCDPSIFPEAECPVAMCTDASAGCTYVLDHYIINSSGDCCPALCYAEDSEGKECPPSFVPGEPCTPTDASDTLCPVAGCSEAPVGCDYKLDEYVFRDEGNCCAKLCFAVDGEGNECNEDGSSDAGNPNGLFAVFGSAAMVVWSIVSCARAR